MTEAYDPHSIEPRWQERWESSRAFETPPRRAGQTQSFVSPACPFTSGNLHLGHVRSYTIADALVRYRRAQGEAVLFSVGFDAFGLPAEMAAIERGIDPRTWVERCRETMIGQFRRMGFSFDWARSIITSDPVSYKVPQWIFLRLYERGLVYEATQQVNWCERCKTTLALMQCADGTCWRCHEPVVTKVHAEWFIKLTAFLSDLAAWLDHPEGLDDLSRKCLQVRYGRTQGVDVELEGEAGALVAFTPHADALDEARFVHLSPEHPEIGRWVTGAEARAAVAAIGVRGLTREDRAVEKLQYVDTGESVLLPGTKRRLRVVVSPIPELRYGGGASLGMPAREAADARIAEELALEAQPAFDASRVPAREAQRFTCRDWPVSRSRCWGTPIPIVHCAQCGTVPVRDEDLPVLLPDDLRPTGEGNPLDHDERFKRTSCPNCDGPAERETRTLDCHIDAFHLWMGPLTPPGEREGSMVFLHPDLERWLPGLVLICGSDAAGAFFTDVRFSARAARDYGCFSWMPTHEPFRQLLSHEMILKDGRKMSKHLGNTVDPNEVVAEYGADALRLCVASNGAPQKQVNWSDIFLKGSARFLRELWTFVNARIDFFAQPATIDELMALAPDKQRVKLKRWRGTALERVARAYEANQLHQVAQNLQKFFDFVKEFEKRALAERGALELADRQWIALCLQELLQLLNPICPHVTEELWERTGGEGTLAEGRWPIEPEEALAEPRAGS